MKENKLLMNEKNTVDKALAMQTESEKETINKQIKDICFIK